MSQSANIRRIISTSTVEVLPSRERAFQPRPDPHFVLFGLAFPTPSKSLHNLLHRLRNTVLAPQSTRRVLRDHVLAVFQNALVVTPEPERPVAVSLVAVRERIRSTSTPAFFDFERPWKNAVDGEVVSVFHDSGVFSRTNLLETSFARFSFHRFEPEELGRNIEILIGVLAGQLEVYMILVDVLLFVV